MGTIVILFSICYSFFLNHLFKNVCIAEFLENKGGIFIWSRGQVCVLPNIIKTMSPSKAKVEQVFVKPILKNWSFPSLGFLSYDENLLFMRHPPGLLCITSRDNANVSEVAGL